MESLLEGLDTSLNSAMNSIRSSVHNLHDESETLREITEGIIKDFENCTMEYDMSEIIPNKIKYCFAAIIKEALSNVIKHSNATAVKNSTQRTSGIVSALYRRQWHPGRRAFPLRKQPGSIILKQRDRSFQYRTTGLKILNGNLQITIQKGFRLFITIPKEQEY